MNDAIVLLSGGIDSTTALAMTRATGRRCHALSFRYGQRHAVELAAAARVAAALGVTSHETIDLDLRAIGGSALTADIAVPKGRTEAEIIRAGVKLGVDYSLTHSCYDPDPTGAACGGCDSCQLRRRGFESAGVDDPTIYSGD